jgi:uncharacterized Zn-finger protein
LTRYLLLFPHTWRATTDVRMYPCSLCNKAFKMKQHLERHLTIHSGEAAHVERFQSCLTQPPPLPNFSSWLLLWFFLINWNTV